jgi:RHS repeat-associated protein
MFYLSNQRIYLTRYRAYITGGTVDFAGGRWLSRDPIAEAGGINLYGYVEGNPVNFRDPLGLTTKGATNGAIIGGILGSVGGLTSGNISRGAAAGAAAGASIGNSISDALTPPSSGMCETNPPHDDVDCENILNECFIEDVLPMRGNFPSLPVDGEIAVLKSCVAAKAPICVEKLGL